MNDPYIKTMFGINAIHVPLNIVIQEGDRAKGRVAIIGVSGMPTNNHPLHFDSTKTHQFILGDAIIRPRLVYESDHLRGTGLTGIITSRSMSSLEEWDKLIIKDGERI